MNPQEIRIVRWFLAAMLSRLAPAIAPVVTLYCGFRGRISRQRSSCPYKVSVRRASRSCLSSAGCYSVQGPFSETISTLQSTKITVVEYDSHHVNTAGVPGTGRRYRFTKTPLQRPNASGRAISHVQLTILMHACLAFETFMERTTPKWSGPRPTRRGAHLLKKQLNVRDCQVTLNYLVLQQRIPRTNVPHHDSKLPPQGLWTDPESNVVALHKPIGFP